MTSLKDKHEAFCRQYLVDFNATQAAIRAGYSPRTAGVNSHALLKKHEIAARLAELKAEQAKRLDMTADDIVGMWWDTATANPNELTQHCIGACRYCHGKDHGYQWKSPREFKEAVAQYLIAKDKKGRDKDDDAIVLLDDGTPAEDVLKPTDEGGYGYRITAEPNENCPECAGLGVGYVVTKDTRKLSAQARLLYNGVKQTANGLEILTADRQKAMEHVARRLGLNKEAVVVETGGALAAWMASLKTTGAASAPIGHKPRSILEDDGDDA